MGPILGQRTYLHAYWPNVTIEFRMTFREWIHHGPLRRDKRQAKRLGFFQEASVRRFEDDENSEPEKVELLDFSSGGLKMRLQGPVEVGQDVWIRARVRHVQRDEDGSFEAGVSWDE